MSKSNFTTKKIIVLSVLSAIGSVLMVIEIPFIPPLKLDISDSTVIVGGVLYGPLGAMIIALIKSIIHFVFFSSGDYGVGEFVAFVASLSYTLPFLFSFKLMNKISNNIYIIRILPSLVGTLSLVIIMFFFNIAISFQLWSYVMFNKFMDYNKIIYLSFSFIPGNIIKGIVLSIIFYILSFRLEQIYDILSIKNPLLNNENRKNE